MTFQGLRGSKQGARRPPGLRTGAAATASMPSVQSSPAVRWRSPPSSALPPKDDAQLCASEVWRAACSSPASLGKLGLDFHSSGFLALKGAFQVETISRQLSEVISPGNGQGSGTFFVLAQGSAGVDCV